MAKEQRTIPVHALGEERVHLALPHHGRLRQGRLRTLCGKQAVGELPLFAPLEAKLRCRACFGKVDEHGYLKAAEGESPAEVAARRGRPGAKIIPLAPGGKGGRARDR